MRILPPKDADGRVRHAASIRSPGRGWERQELWFDVDESAADAVTDRGDPFLLATVTLAMRQGEDLCVAGRPVSTSLLRSLEEFQQVWHAWYGLRVVDLAVEVEDEPDSGDAATRPAVVAFSGGVDSAFSAYRNAVTPGRRAPRLAAGLTLHGMDIPLSDAVGYEGAARRAERMLASIGLEQLRVRTNAWDLLPNERAHYAALGVAASLHLVSARFGTGLIPATLSYKELATPADSSPVTDWMFASRAFGIVHDGASASRLEKLRRLGEWPEALDGLRVCLQGPRHDTNCGRCNKCLLTYAEMLVLGLEPRCFDAPPSPELFRRWAWNFPSNALYVREMRIVVAEARDRGLDDPWVRMARAKLLAVTTKDAVRGLAPNASRRAQAAHRRAARLRRSRAPGS